MSVLQGLSYLQPVAVYFYDDNLLAWVEGEQPILEAGSVTVTGTVNQGSAALTPWLVSSKVALTASVPTSATIGTSSGIVAAANASRKSLVITNLSNNYLYIGIGTTALDSKGLVVFPYGNWTMNEYTYSIAQINGIASDVNSLITVQEFT